MARFQEVDIVTKHRGGPELVVSGTSSLDPVLKPLCQCRYQIVDSASLRQAVELPDTEQGAAITKNCLMGQEDRLAVSTTRMIRDEKWRKYEVPKKCGSTQNHITVGDEEVPTIR